MKTNLTFFLSIFFLCLANHLEASQLDSLHRLSPENDTEKVKLKLDLADAYRIKGELNTAELYAQQSLELAEEIEWSRGIAKAYNALTYVKIYESKYEEAMKHAISALAVAEKNGDRESLGYTFLYIGYINTTLQEFDSAKTYYLKSLSIREQIGSNYELGFSYTYLANLYRETNQLDTALFYHRKALELRKRTTDQRSIADSYLLIGGTLYKKEKYQEALEYCINALSIYLELEDKKRLGETYRQLAEIKIKLDKYREAELYLVEALKLAKESGSLDNMTLIFQELSELNELGNDYQEALTYLKKHYALKDSIASEQVYREASKLMLKYKVNKEKRIAELMREQERLEQRIITYSAFAGILVLLVFAAFVIHRLRITKRQNTEIEKKNREIQSQKQELEITHDQLQIQHGEIQDSIAYAKRIQSAILPPLNQMKKHLTDSFVLYKPKDVVAGDFYWFTSISLGGNSSGLSNKLTFDMEQTGEAQKGNQENELIYFAAADCTGHGVPGAMVSVICNNALNRSVKEFGLIEPGEILDKSRELVIKEFEKSEEEVQDGMDIALCSLRASRLRSKSAELKYAGANNPLWIIRKGKFDQTLFPKNSRFLESEVGDYSLVEIKAHKEPIGKYHFHSPFESHSIDLQAGDTVYLFSDGYSDQFGGDNGKKLKSLNFKSILLSIQEMELSAQQSYLDQAFDKWKGEHEQVDDVCVIGVRI
ncbi:MAG: tetratricopeptide repeat protein [Vicingaceae bacterium]